MARPKSNRTCDVEGCTRKHMGRGYCSTHYQRIVVHGYAPDEVPSRRKKENPGYRAMHLRLNILRGYAADQVCVDCGNPAAEWSLRHDAMPIYVSDRANSLGKEYSTNIWAYEARCRCCHRAYDGNQPPRPGGRQ